MAIVDPPMVNKFMLVPENNVFIGAQPGSALVLHKTASGTSAEQIANFFINDPGKKSSHFVIGQDGEVVQCVHLIDGAGANCCVETGYDPYWNPLLQKFGNLNRCTISIEHVDSASDNSTPLTTAQKASSFKLIKWLADQYGFSKDDIKSHNSIDPINRARCPGNYPWSELFTYLANGGQDVSTTIDLNTPHMSDYFALVNGNQWQRKNAPNGKTIILHGDMLKYYQTNGCVPYCGFSSAGLPLSNELKIEQFGPEFAKLAGSGIVVVFFERAVWVYDKDHIIDHPLDAGTVYPLHLYSKPGQDPLVGQLLKQIADLQAQIVQLQTQPPPTNNPDPIAAIHAVQAAVAPFK